MSQSIDIKPTGCPLCQQRLDSAKDIFRQARPQPYSLTVCLSCGGLLQFTKDLDLRALSRAEIARLPPEIRDALLQVQALAKDTRRV